MNDSSRAQATAEIKRIAAGTDWAYIVQACARIVWQATRLGLYAATAVMVYRAILAADAAARTRSTIPGGEVMTVPIIFALFLIGWSIRGDVERSWRRLRRQARRRSYNGRL